jgi:hypothetical protein
MNTRTLSSLASLSFVVLALASMTGCAASAMNEDIAAPTIPVEVDASPADCLSRIQPLSTPKPLKKLAPSPVTMFGPGASTRPGLAARL